MTTPLLGHVFVVAGVDADLPEVADALADAGAFVALVFPMRVATRAAAAIVADPTDGSTWERAAPHIEQRLGPVDGVVTDARTADPIANVFTPDLRRRGHGGVVVREESDDVSAVMERLARTLPTGPPRPELGEPRR